MSVEENLIWLPNCLSSKSDEDRISTLPDVLLHQILSFMDMNEVVRTSLLSKRWSYVWKSVPSVKINDPFYISKEDLARDKYEKCVECLFRLRDVSSAIQKFHLVCPNYHDTESLMEDTGQIETWISSAIRHRVQDIHLENLLSTRLGTIRLASQVKILKLSNVDLPGTNTTRELHLNSPVLEKLIVKECYHHSLTSFYIHALRLEHLIVDNDLDVYHCKLHLCTPNLEWIQLLGSIYLDYSLGSLSNLVSADIDIYLYGIPKEDVCMLLNKLLGGVSNAKSLTLAVECSTALEAVGSQNGSGVPNMLEGMPILFRSLRYLKLTKWYENVYVGPIMKLLESFPCIETLVLEEPKEIFILEEGGYWGGNSSSKCMLNQLKFIEIHYPNRCEGLIKFFEFLVGKTIALEKITVKAAKTMSRNKEEELIEFSKKLQSLPKASSVTVLLIQQRATRVNLAFNDSPAHEMPQPESVKSISS